MGLATFWLYALNNGFGYTHGLHDMNNGVTVTADLSGLLDEIPGTPGQAYAPLTVTTNSNGTGTPAGFSETANYDQATGLGTPDAGALVRLFGGW